MFITKGISGLHKGNLFENVKGRWFISLFFCGVILLSGIPARALPSSNHAPVFAAGIRSELVVCENSATVAINSHLAITDSDAGQTETWYVLTAPAHGSLSGFPAMATSSGGTITPSWLTYTPTTGFSGNDSFIIEVSDGGATAQTMIVVTVNPSPVLSSSLTAPAICDQSVFSYVPTSVTPGCSFAWHRVYVPGISNPTVSGADNPNETLGNYTNYDVNATYIYTVSANGCSTAQNVIVTVHPTPRLGGSTSDSSCSGSLYHYYPWSLTPGTTFSWSRAVVAGITPSVTASGTGTISELLVNTTVAPITVTYAFSLAANGCTSSRNLNVTVVPQSVATAITTVAPANLCAGVQCQNFGAASTPAAGFTYTWSAANALVSAVGDSGQYCLVSFPYAGAASVTLTVGGGTICAAGSTYNVSVAPASLPALTVVYYNNQFVLQDNTQDTYQWGYDDVVTLDSSLIDSAIFQSYPDAVPDFLHKYYWVITTKDGCMQKTYFNGPRNTVGVQPLSAMASLTVAPNPAGDVIRINNNGIGSSKLVITDVTGKVLITCNDATANVEVNVSALSAGLYFVSSLSNDIIVGTVRFVKSR